MDQAQHARRDAELLTIASLPQAERIRFFEAEYYHDTRRAQRLEERGEADEETGLTSGRGICNLIGGVAGDISAVTAATFACGPVAGVNTAIGSGIHSGKGKATGKPIFQARSQGLTPEQADAMHIALKASNVSAAAGGLEGAAGAVTGGLSKTASKPIENAIIRKGVEMGVKAGVDAATASALQAGE
ncbi:hypothetical protein SAMN05421823_11546 [Catalinimonas alkaloidigena]|uniref:Uncharacterized protein n=2 Tax=Catalinimonas alkaloidigena TaxID=1075417 RepID=A0A1G9U0W2_9BACT|nr:hypothetical protein SAMN05421823_11546 [Catalinimonas alkaloidigena]